VGTVLADDDGEVVDALGVGGELLGDPDPSVFFVGVQAATPVATKPSPAATRI
jgi:hypothetical protein